MAAGSSCRIRAITRRHSSRCPASKRCLRRSTSCRNRPGRLRSGGCPTVGLSRPAQSELHGRIGVRCRAGWQAGLSGADGSMVIDGLPFLPPNTADGRCARDRAGLVAGGRLARVCAVYARRGRLTGRRAGRGWRLDPQREGQTVLLSASDYTPGEGYRHFTGPIEWRPGGSEFLVRWIWRQRLRTR